MKNFHDVFFRSIFSNIDRIERLLRTILARDILDLFDLSTLKVEPSVVVKKLEIRADLVVSVMFRNSKKKAKIILILDHKSWPDRDVIQQMQKYQLMIVNEYCRDKGEFPLPVLCIIFYHGDKKCKMPSSLHEDWISRGFIPKDEFKKLSPYLMNFRPYVFDLSKFDISKQAMDSMKSILYAFEDIWSLKKCRSRKERKAVLHKILLSIKKDLKYESKQYRIDMLLAIKQYFTDYDSHINEGLFKQVSKEVSEELGGGSIMEDLDYTMESIVRKKVQERVQQELEKKLQERVQEEVQKKLQERVQEEVQKKLQERVQEEVQKKLQERVQEEVQKKLQERVQEEVQKKLQERVQEGMQAGRKEITLKLLKAEMSVEKVSEITGLSKQEIRKFQKDT